MTRFKPLLRGLWLCLPMVLISGVALVAVSAQTATPTVEPGRLSTKDMPSFEAYPSGMNGLAASNPPPLIMLVMSRDEQLFNKAYPDYTDLNSDGVIDTTYQNTFEYNGYFDPDICYDYGSGTFYSSTSASNHQCNGSLWSGNFLNWVAMSRLDIIRWVLYGGTRSIDQANKTVLERAEIPNDLHAWAKVYSGTDINKYTPYTGTRTFCNVSSGKTGGWGTLSDVQSGITSTPQIRVASGDWADWATTAKLQCQWKGNNAEGDSNRPSKTGNDERTARVTVCQNNGTAPNESFCVATGSSLKPEGLLQKYSKEGSADVKRFGLITGSWVNARKGGQVRRNIGKLASNKPGTGCASGDEFNSLNGTFCYKTASPQPGEGIIKTLDRLQIVGWNGSDYGTSGDARCNAPGGTAWGSRGYDIQDNPAMCPDFGNPLAGMYAEALRYIQGASGPTYSDSGALPTPAWVDPYGDSADGEPRNLPCASCSIVVISSGLNSFDDANVPDAASLDANTYTNALQSKEGIEGSYLLSTYYNDKKLTGAPDNGSLTAAGTKFSDIAICSPVTIGGLSDVTGICLGTPGQEGSYAIAGLSYRAWADPIRTDDKVKDDFQVKTYGISLSENLPSFSIPVGNNSISLSPTCRADPANKGTYASCYIGSVAIGARKNQSGNTTYGLVPNSDYPNVGSYYFVWEDSQYGSDHDQDATNVISWCVGDSCNKPSSITTGVAICDPIVVNGVKSTAATGGACTSSGQLAKTMGPNDVLVRNQWLGFSSSGMYIGYQLSGADSNAVSEISNSGVSFGCNMLADIVCNSAPQVKRFTSTGTAVTTLQSPLWYAAKYSGFEGDTPALPIGATDPANYFFARNAGALKDQLNSVFQDITSSAANNFGNATTPSSSNDVQGSGLSYQVQYFQQRDGVKWTGSLQAFWSDVEGYQREGTDSGAQELQDDAMYVTTGPDTSEGALTGAMTSYRCSVKPEPAEGETSFDPSKNSNCSMVTTGNPLHPAWDIGKWLNAYYDPSAVAGSNDAKAIANLAKQRTYGNATDLAGASQRYIFTYLTSVPNGQAASGTVVDGTQSAFVWNDAACTSDGTYSLSTASGFCGGIKDGKRYGNFGLLNEKDPSMAKKLVNWVRGVEYDSYRSRTGTNGTHTYRLGDIVDSSPAVVGVPAESYDLLYSDYSFASFRANYRDRRQMIYVGANDGMLHAFNGGFYVPGHADPDPTKATNPTIVRQLASDSNMKTGNDSVPLGNNWQLGQEVWAYVPNNLLPHLRWLADKSYTHVFYVDGSPVISDVQAFVSGDSDPTTAACKAGTSTVKDAKGHVCGWGTVMVVPFRLGGGAVKVDTVGDAKDASIEQSNSAYVILDVTDPEQPPTVLGEITTGTYTTAAPAFSVHRKKDGTLHYYLTIGSGPIDNGGPNGEQDKPVAAPDGNLKVWVYDIADIVAKSSTPVAALGTGPEDSFAGDMVASDFDLNNSAEGVYFGVVTNPADLDLSKATGVFGGGLWKLDMNTAPADKDGNAATVTDTSDPSTWTLEQVIDTGQPVTIRPTLALDSTNRAMVYFGTGRSFTTNDDSGASAQGVQQQYIYGVSDNSLLVGFDDSCKEMPATGPLFDASAIEVNAEDGTISGLPSDVDALKDITTMDALAAVLTSVDKETGCYTYSGWKMKLTAGNSGTSVQQPSERIVSSQVLYNGILLTPSYIPANLAAKTAAKQSACNPVPVPGSSNLYGMNYQTGTADQSLLGSFGSSGGKVNRKVGLGSGKASSPVLHVGNGKISAALGISGGTKLQQIGALGAASNGEISWREPMDNQ
jgi:type IV pilus assembly protein PilY1